MKLKSILCLSAAALGIGAFTALPMLRAQVSPGLTQTGGTFAQRFMLRRAIQKLHLTDDQKESGLAVLRNHQPAIKPLVDQLIKERFALHDLLKSPTSDEMAIRAGSARVASVEADLAVQKAYLIRDLRAIGTPAQIKTLDDFETGAQTRALEFVDLVSNWIASS